MSDKYEKGRELSNKYGKNRKSKDKIAGNGRQWKF